MADLLIVDDDVETGELLADLLREEGHEVRVARNGREGLAALRVRSPELVLLDVEMPVLTGPEMAHAMFLHDLGQEEIPVVLLSGVSGLSEVARHVGTAYFLAKPYDLTPLLVLMKKALVERLAPHPQLELDPGTR